VICVVDIPGVVPQITPLRLPSLSFLINFSFVILLLDCVVAVTWKKQFGLTIKRKPNFKNFHTILYRKPNSTNYILRCIIYWMSVLSHGC